MLFINLYFLIISFITLYFIIEMNLNELMELDQTRTQNIHFFNKYMGEKYNPHNYKIDRNSKK